MSSSPAAPGATATTMTEPSGARRVWVVVAAAALAALLVLVGAIALVASYWHARHVADIFTDPSPIPGAPDMVPWLPLTTDGLLFAAVGVIYWRRLVRKDIPDLVWATFAASCAGTIGANAVAAQRTFGGFVTALWPVVTMIGVDLLIAYAIPALLSAWHGVPHEDPHTDPPGIDEVPPTAVPVGVNDDGTPVHLDLATRTPHPAGWERVGTAVGKSHTLTDPADDREPNTVANVDVGDGTRVAVPVHVDEPLLRVVPAAHDPGPTDPTDGAEDQADEDPAARAEGPGSVTVSGRTEGVSVAAFRRTGATAALRTEAPARDVVAVRWTEDDEAARATLQAEIDAGARMPTPSSMRSRYGMGDGRSKRIIARLEPRRVEGDR